MCLCCVLVLLQQVVLWDMGGTGLCLLLGGTETGLMCEILYTYTAPIQLYTLLDA